jgi:phenylacetate-CoA ligase
VVGELVFTNLTRQGMPLLRYRSRDLASYDDRPCPCGRHSRRISRIQGRTDDMIILKGVNIFPIQIDRALMAMPEVASNYLVELMQEGVNDTMVVKVEIKPDFFQEEISFLKNLQKRITNALKSELLVTPKVELVEHNSLPQTEGKAVRVIDHRQKS